MCAKKKIQHSLLKSKTIFGDLGDHVVTIDINKHEVVDQWCRKMFCVVPKAHTNFQCLVY